MEELFRYYSDDSGTGSYTEVEKSININGFTAVILPLRIHTRVNLSFAYQSATKEYVITLKFI